MLCRVFHMGDGQVRIVFPNYKYKGVAETEQEFMDRVCAKAAADTPLENLPFEDRDPALLPPRAERDKWRTAPGGMGVKVDTSIITRGERIKSLETQLDAELAKPSPDAIKAIKLQRSLDKERGNA